MKKEYGFTLIEMAMVLLILTLLMGGLLLPLSTQFNQNIIKSTKQDLDTLKNALIGFAVINGRLPCPDTNGNGLENNPTSCNSEGKFPWATLALNIGKRDGWGQAFRYRVDVQYTTQPFPNPPDTSSDLKIRDRRNNKLTNENLNSDVIAIILSLGKDKRGNGENGSTNDQIYTQDVSVENRFDDILIWLPKTILINRLVMANRWP